MNTDFSIFFSFGFNSNRRFETTQQNIRLITFIGFRSRFRACPSDIKLGYHGFIKHFISYQCGFQKIHQQINQDQQNQRCYSAFLFI